MEQVSRKYLVAKVLFQKSLRSSAAKTSEAGIGQKRNALVGTNTRVTYHLYPQRHVIKFDREDLKFLSQVISFFHTFKLF